MYILLSSRSKPVVIKPMNVNFCGLAIAVAILRSNASSLASSRWTSWRVVAGIIMRKLWISTTGTLTGLRFLVRIFGFTWIQLPPLNRCRPILDDSWRKCCRELSSCLLFMATASLNFPRKDFPIPVMRLQYQKKDHGCTETNDFLKVPTIPVIVKHVVMSCRTHFTDAWCERVGMGPTCLYFLTTCMTNSI